jgi:hypothetical protein
VKVLKLMVLAATLLATACGDDRFPDYHYKMTIYVGDKAFSSVRALTVTEAGSIVDSGGSTVKRRVEGEAVVMDLGGGQTVYALLSRPDNVDYAQFVPGMALSPHIPKKAVPGEVEQAIQEYNDEHNPKQDSFGDAAEGLQQMVKVQGPKDLPRTLPPRNGRPPMQAWPMFVTFGDPKDPKTVREVSPSSIGVSRIAIEITDEDATTGIEGRLVWLKSHRGALVRTERGKSMFDKPDAQRITEGAFSTEIGL